MNMFKEMQYLLLGAFYNMLSKFEIFFCPQTTDSALVHWCVGVFLLYYLSTSFAHCFVVNFESNISRGQLQKCFGKKVFTNHFSTSVLW